MIFARRWLPAASEPKTSDRRAFAVWVEEYKLAERERRLQVADSSPLVGKNLEELDLRGSAGANIVAIERNRWFLPRKS